jgi:hypothetical protein
MKARSGFAPLVAMDLFLALRHPHETFARFRRAVAKPLLRDVERLQDLFISDPQ